MDGTETVEAPPPGWRFRIGIAFFVLAWICPLFIPLVAATDLPTEWKTTLSGLLLIGGPEVFSFVSVAVLGKPGFLYLKGRLYALLRRAAPSARVSRTRYRIGLVLWIPLALFGAITYYVPHLIPGYEEHRLAINLAADTLFIASFFVLGADFWDKFRSLFLYDAKAMIPEASEG